MINDWRIFLTNRGATVLNEEFIFDDEIHSKPKWICPLSDCGVLAFSGNDASAFLQGQITCNINLVTDRHSTLGAYCNPKGRAIIVFRAFKFESTYYWLAPAQLLPTVIKRLKMYVLRSDVKIQDVSDRWCKIGISNPPKEFSVSASLTIKSPKENGEIAVSEDIVVIKPSPFSDRLIMLAPLEKAKSLWLDLTENQHYHETSSNKWEEMNIQEGIPNLVSETSEQFIPQMLNLDLLGGISLDKGCYTGQEIVARTHYLGKLKRRMFLANCECNHSISPNKSVYDDNDQSHQSVGHVVASLALNKDHQIMLIVLKISNAESHKLTLQDTECKNIKILKLPYDF